MKLKEALDTIGCYLDEMDSKPVWLTETDPKDVKAAYDHIISELTLYPGVESYESARQRIHESINRAATEIARLEKEVRELKKEIATLKGDTP